MFPQDLHAVRRGDWATANHYLLDAVGGLVVLAARRGQPAPPAHPGRTRGRPAHRAGPRAAGILPG